MSSAPRVPISPIAPGTAGSAVGVLLFWPLSGLAWPWQLAATAAVFLVGVADGTGLAEAH